MPETMPTFLDIAIRNASDAAAGLLDETARAHPEVNTIPARTIKGLNFKTRIRTSLPTVGFRGANEGTDPSKSTVENRLIEVYIMNPRWECDQAVADSAEDGAAAYIAEEAGAVMEAAMQKLANQFYYGVTDDPNKGYPGLIIAVDASMVVDAGGTTADTGSSVWMVKYGQMDVQWIFGNNGELIMADPRVESLLDANSKKYTGYVQELLTRPGLKVGRKWSIGRIKKLTEDSGKGLTDDLLGDLFAKFPVSAKPDAIFMSRRSRKQLQQSRTATTPTGQPAPLPTEWEGITIHPTDAIVETEALTL